MAKSVSEDVVETTRYFYERKEYLAGEWKQKKRKRN